MLFVSSVRLAACWFTAGLFAACLSSQGLAWQSSPTAQVQADLPTARQASQSAEGLFLEGVTLAPFNRAQPGRPLVILAMVRNSSSTPRTVVAVARVNAAPELEAATRVVLPPKDQAQVELRMRVPENVSGEGFEYSVSVNDPENPTQVLLDPRGRPLIDSRRMTLTADQLIAALVLQPPPPPRPEWAWPQEDLVMEYEWVVATRADSSHSRRTMSMDHENLPTLVADWQGIDEIVISNDRPFHDPAVLSSIRRWIAGGGRAWVMFDQISPENLRLILSDGMSVESLDDIELNRFVVETSVFTKLAEADRTVESENPIHFRRSVQSGGHVTHQIDGYPVAIWFRMGKGLVLVTTLSAEGWLEPRKSQKNPGEEFNTPLQSRAWAASMADRFHEVKLMKSPIESAEIQYPLQLIGNPVLSRGYVLAVVFGYCALIGAAAGVCWWTNHMLRLVWLIPSLAVLSSLPLFISASTQRREIRDTSARLQLIEVQPGSRALQAMEWSASYVNQAVEGDLQASSDAFVTWPKSSQQMDLRRWEWRDYDHWQLSSAGWPKGIWRLNSKYPLPARNLDVIGRIDQSGLHLQMPEELKETLAESVVQFNAGDPVPCGSLKPGSNLDVPEVHLSQIDSWLTGTIVSDEQRRREQVYRQLQAVEGQPAYPSYPALLAWTELWPGPMKWTAPREERGAALVVLPIKLLPTPSGQAVHVPHSVVRIENSPRLGAISTAFSNESGWWRQATTLPTIIQMRCSLPQQVLPLQANQATCHIQMRAPQRRVALHVIKPDGQKLLLREFVSPTAAQSVNIDDPAVLTGLRDGAIEFEINIGSEIRENESEFGDQQAMWQVDYFRLSADGRVEQR